MSRWLATGLNCPTCGFAKHNTFFNSKKDLRILGLNKNSILMRVSRSEVFGVGIRKCKSCKTDYAVVFCQSFEDLYVKCYCYQLTSNYGLEVQKLLEEKK